ncbi:unnamed protein product [Prorocentrum cordatum]|uniref:Uncharacterized protein n=1 Tax=Prorocentrum cordatum TaxID=2364126 RepID=A0ABN9R3E8_9DINO|nr:unnamed protein product [Polarella glacialis]
MSSVAGVFWPVVISLSGFFMSTSGLIRSALSHSCAEHTWHWYFDCVYVVLCASPTIAHIGMRLASLAENIEGKQFFQRNFAGPLIADAIVCIVDFVGYVVPSLIRELHEGGRGYACIFQSPPSPHPLRFRTLPAALSNTRWSILCRCRRPWHEVCPVRSSATPNFNDDVGSEQFFKVDG